MTSPSELACVYSALILHDDGVPITADKIEKLIKAAKVDVEPFWPGLFAKALEGHGLDSLIQSAGAPGAGGAAPAAGGAAAGGGEAEAKEEEKKEERNLSLTKSRMTTWVLDCSTEWLPQQKKKKMFNKIYNRNNLWFDCSVYFLLGLRIL
ncbi:60S acidic ribosomal protein P1 [Desmophyllum pertusum]|uniref:Large ribosomal subunit protein P1 n=1 Tax=Desmophyllum pertusum TaxID=174260 RepID=A0A9W9YSC8_9CNID|nr:60S acidic ribosomal protein P1 [Desmophyllum pertusum]